MTRDEFYNRLCDAVGFAWRDRWTSEMAPELRPHLKKCLSAAIRQIVAETRSVAYTIPMTLEPHPGVPGYRLVEGEPRRGSPTDGAPDDG